MKRFSSAVAALALVLLTQPGRAGSVETRFVEDRASERTPLDYFKLEGGYVFESELEDDDFNYGEQDAFELEAEYTHRFHLSGRWYLRAGVSYNRFTFGDSFAPVPEHLQSIAAVLSIDYMVGADRGAFLEIRPGFYGEDNFDSDSFDVPITLARAWVLKRDKIFLLTGVNVAFLRGQMPIIPIVGLVWHLSDQWLLYAVPPEPRLVFMPNKHLDLWIGGQLTGGSFRTDHDSNIFPPRLSGAQVDYTDYRAGGGFVWHVTDAVHLDVGGGYSIQRRFNYERADIDFESGAAPYLRASLKAEF
jgi:hypothetical protein